MSQPRIRTISGSNFRSLRDPFSVKLPEKGLLLLEGKNNDTGGSSGSGKSSLALAIQFALGTCPFAATELGSWDGEAPEVKLGLSDGDSKFTVARGKKFELTSAGTAVTGSAAQKEEALTKLLGLDPDMLQALTYRGQRKPGLFLSKTDAEKKEFLTKLLGLDKFEAAQEAGALKIKALEAQITTDRAVRDRVFQNLQELGEAADHETLQAECDQLQAMVEAGERQVLQLKSELPALAAAAKEAVRIAGQAFDAEFKSATEVLTALNADVSVPDEDKTELERLAQLVVQCTERLQRLVSEDAEKTKAIDVEVARIQTQIAAANRVAGQLAGLKKESDRLGAELQKLEASVCPTCDRAWDEAVQRKGSIVARRQELAAEIAEATSVQAGIPSLREEQERLRGSFVANPTIERLRGLKAQNEQAHAGERSRLAQARMVHASAQGHARAEARARVSEVSSRRSAAERTAAAAAEEPQRAMASRIELEAAEVVGLSRRLQPLRIALAGAVERRKQAVRLRAQLMDAEAGLATLEAEVAAEKDFQHLIGREGFLGGIFDEVLAEIGDETSQTLAAVANTRHCTFRFKSETTTQKGTTKRAIVPTITVNGHEAPMGSALSGGMLSTLELAVDLAVGAVISRRSGVSPGWLILDESFDGLDPISKESCLEILQKYARDRLVIVVDHMSETKGLFTDRIVVEYRGGDSRVTYGGATA